MASAELVYSGTSPQNGDITEAVEQIDSPAKVKEHMEQSMKRRTELLEAFTATAEAEAMDDESLQGSNNELDEGEEGEERRRRPSTTDSIYAGVRSAGSWFYRFLGSERNSMVSQQPAHTNSLRSNRTSTHRSSKVGAPSALNSLPRSISSGGSPLVDPVPFRDPVFNQSFQNKLQKSEKSRKAQTMWAKATWYAMQEVNAKREKRSREEGNRSVTGKFERGASGKKGAGQRGSLITQKRNSSAGLGFEEVVLEAMRKENESKANAKRNSAVGLVDRVIHATYFHWLMFFTTAFSLYGMDIYILAAPDASRDRDMYIINVTCFAIFGIEWLARSLIMDRFIFSFFWWLDIIATASFIPDVVWLAREEDVFASAVGVLVLARGARVGARMSRIVRVVALFSRTRLTFRSKHLGEQMLDPTSPQYDPSLSMLQRESHLGRRLDHKVSLHTMVVVGIMLILLILNGVLFTNAEYHTGIKALIRAYDALQGNPQAPASRDFAPFLADFVAGMDDTNHAVHYLELDGQVLYGDVKVIDDIRRYPAEYEVQTVKHTVGAEGNATTIEAVLHFSIEQESRREVLLNLVNVTAVILLLMLSTTNISRVIREEVVNPIMSLMDTIESFATNPLKPLKEVTDNKFKETIVVQNSVVRIGSLLRLSLGEAGSRIMSRNLRSGKMRLDRPGDFVHAFFGFCDIRNFTDLTEVLRPEVVQVVNQFAYYVHSAVSQNYGAPNKNIGDAFLLVWKPKPGVSASQMANSALRSYVQIILEISSSKELHEWAQREDVQARLPGFKMAMGFGIHYGWAIECAVGSLEKIDATYLSPHVNMASRLEAATKQYGTQILISGDTYALFSQDIQMLCRLVDRVTVKGSNVPMDLYTYDVPPSLGEGRAGGAARMPSDAIAASYNSSTSRLTQAASAASQTSSADMSPSEFLGDLARPSISEDFRSSHYLAMQNYLGGPGGTFANWKTAMDHFVVYARPLPPNSRATRGLCGVWD